jgi:hypothetical protein
MKPLNNLTENDNTELLQNNQKFFENCIDLIPARIYLNVDDRKQWFRLLNRDVDDADDEEEEMEEKDEDEDEDEDKKNGDEENFIKRKHSRFDPIYYKTVSQLYRELEKCKKLNKPVNFEQVKTIQKKTAAADRVEGEEGLKKRKMIKLENKNQSSGSGANSESKKEGDSNNKSKKLSKKQQEKKEKRKLENLNLELTQSSGDDTTNGGKSPNKVQKKPILNQNGQIVYSKFDFSVDGVDSLKNGNNSNGGSKSKHSKVNANSNVKPKDYKVLVKKLQEKKEKLTKLKETEPEKAFEMETNEKWRTALDKASGVKVKDDIDLLKRSIKRVEKKKEKTRKEWSERVQKVEHSKQKAQEKRNKNIEARKDKKKEKKVKRLKKRGRLLPGF